MICYKIKHKPTGLYFKPSRGKSNLSTKGKLYSMQPNITWIGTNISIVIWTCTGKLSKVNKTIVDYFNIDTSSLKSGSYFSIKTFVNVPLEDWEIETYNSE
jgi:hypothetical protein